MMMGGKGNNCSLGLRRINFVQGSVNLNPSLNCACFFIHRAFSLLFNLSRGAGRMYQFYPGTLCCSASSLMCGIGLRPFTAV